MLPEKYMKQEVCDFVLSLEKEYKNKFKCEDKKYVSLIFESDQQKLRISNLKRKSAECCITCRGKNLKLVFADDSKKFSEDHK